MFDFLKGVFANENAEPLSRNQYNPTQYASPTESKYKSRFGSNYTSRFAHNPDLDTPEGLYRIAQQSGLQKQADRVIRDNSGEDLNKIFSGGFISDTFDVLNMLDYGVVGLLKGKTFEEGVIARESFSDKDSLGKYGLTGVIAGIALDIVADPLTYIAPWTIAKKIPGVIQVSKAAKDAVIGREVINSFTNTVGDTVDIATREGNTVQNTVRGWLTKVSYMFGADPRFKEAHDNMMAMKGVEIRGAMEMVGELAKINPKSVENLLASDKTGRFVRRPIEDLARELSAEDFAKVQPIWNKIDDLGKQLTDLGVLGQEKYEDNLGAYIRSVYKEYELAKKKGFNGFKAIGNLGQKAREEALTPEKMTELGQIDDPAYIAGATMIHMIQDVHTASFMKKMVQFASDKELPGFKQVADTRRFMPSQGSTAEAAGHITEINKKIAPLFRELRATHKDDVVKLKEIDDLEKEMTSLKAETAYETFKVAHEGEKGFRVVRKKGVAHRPLPERLEPLAQLMRKFDTFEEAVNSRAGIEMQKLWHDGTLFRNGFGKLSKAKGGLKISGGDKAMRDFFNAAKKQFTPGKTNKVTEEIAGDIPKIQEMVKRIQKLSDKVTKIKEIDLTSIEDSFSYLEQTLKKLHLDKEDLVDVIHNNKMSDLAGKWIPEDMHAYIDEIINPGEAFGNQVIAQFKYMKVVMNPATHVRNVLSNRILNWWKLGIGPWRLDLDIRAISELKNHGKYWKEWTSVGGGADTMAANELRGILKDDAAFLGKRLGNYWRKTEKTLGDIYQWEEAQAKMYAFIAMRDKGHSTQEAYKFAEVATFNYAQVTPFIKKMRTSLFGVPFITFSAKAAPVAIETMLKHPGRVSVFGKIKNDIKNASDIEETEAEAESEPAWIKEGFYFKLPWKDDQGRSMYFDLTYILPFGDIVSGTMFTRPVSRETGTKEALPISIASTNPVFNLLKEITRNETFTGQKIFNESDSMEQVTYDLTRHIMRTFVPPWFAAQTSPGYDKSTGEKLPAGIMGSLGASSQNTKKSLTEELAAYVGAKVQPVSASINESFQERNKKKGLQTLLLENNIIENFSRNYIPKD